MGELRALRSGSAIMRFLHWDTLIICMLAVNLCASQQASPTISSISSEQIKDIGDSVSLECDITNVGKFTVGWQKTNRDRSQSFNTISLGPTLAVAEERFRLSDDKENNTMKYTLTISDIVNTDAGLYECQIQVNSTNKVTATVELLVRHPPILQDNLIATAITKAEGEDVKLACAAEGYPRPSITWKREYSAILPIGGQSFSGNELSLSSLAKEDRGTYFCIADNGVGKPDSKTINLEVEFAPVISVPRPKVAQATEYDIELECVVQAFPSPAISWYKKGQQIHNGGSYSISQTGQPDDVTTSVVKITSVGSSHYGDYICKASNKEGHAEARLNLYEQRVPNINFSGLKWSNSGHALVSHLGIVVVTMLLATLL
ncbi:lachesin-like [Toxorhynchites rutilus septentrionalis]|uniref:lachesin-like n=1 Tax=Toxorhynchites rutilus septentrionalis TaxID=329112 RepID=UPI0024798A12|nr:lachesin-like [Toxorhynchites rutilus septentrionalis]